MTIAVYSLLLLAALALGSPYWLARMLFSGRYRAGLGQRLGGVPAELRHAVSGRDVIWLHAVSVGEVLAATELVRKLREAKPGWVVAVSTTTATGQRLAQERLADSPVFYLPLDFAFAVRRYLRVLRPRMLVLMESELWPRLIDECAKNGVPVAIVNARVSDRSFPRYMRLRKLWRPFLREIGLFLAQSEETAERLVKIGAPAERVRMLGNLKFDVQAKAATALTQKIAALTSGRRVIVAGSTLAGEEEMLLAAWAGVREEDASAVLLIAPRHPDRFDEVAAKISGSGYACLRCSELTGVAATGGTVLLLDTIGDLASAYKLGTVAFVGGSLVDRGGHSPLEPAQFGVPVVMGPSYENFRKIVEQMMTANGIRIVQDGRELQTALRELLRDRAGAKALGERGQAVSQAQTGATKRTVEALLELLAVSA